MKKINLKIILTSVLAVCLLCTSYAYEIGEKSLLWKISGNGLQQESYLFGTIHVICEEQFFMDDRIMQALESTEVIALELDLSDPNMMAEMQKHSMNPGFKNIKGDFEPEHALAVDEFLTGAYGAGLDQFGVLKPFVLSSMVLMKRLPCEAQSSYEMFFVEMAQDKDLGITGLETVEFQIGVFDAIPQKTQLDELGKMVMDNQGMEEFESLVNTFLQEDVEKLLHLITEDGMFQEFGDLLLTQRNENWIPIIEALIQEKPTFIAVGSGHLASEKGLINLLREAGYTVEAVRSN